LYLTPHIPLMSSLDALEASLSTLRAQLGRGSTVQDFQQVGHQSREFLITLAQSVHDPAKHSLPNTETPSRTDAKAMLGAFISHTLPGEGHEEARRLARSAVDMANAVQHDRMATKQDAQLAVEGCAAVLAIAAILSGESLAPAEAWQGISVGNRYFAWGGPTLHALDDRDPVPAPEPLLHELRARGITHRFGTKAKLRNHLAQGWAPAWETDRHSWRREVLYGADGDQVLLIKNEAA